MATLTLDRVLTDAEHLPSDEQEILEDLLRKRRIEAWRAETATEAKNVAAAFDQSSGMSARCAAIIARTTLGTRPPARSRPSTRARRKRTPCSRACSSRYMPSCCALNQPQRRA